MVEKTDFEKQMQEICNQEPITVTFKGKERKIHFFQSDTVARYEAELEKASESDTMKERHQRQVNLLAIVLSDLYRSQPLFRGLRRWKWKVKLSHGTYNEVEALQLLEAATIRIQHSKLLEIYRNILAAQVLAVISQANGQNDQLEKLLNEKRENWKGGNA